MKKSILFTLLSVLSLTLFSQVSITCPSDKTMYTNSDGVQNNNCSSIVMASIGVYPIWVDPNDTQGLRCEISGSTIYSGFGSCAGVTLNSGPNLVTYRMVPANLECSFNITVLDNEVPRSGSTTDVYDVCALDSTIQFPTITWFDNCTAATDLVISYGLVDTTFVTGCATKTAALKYIKKLTRVVTAHDEVGNSNSYTQTIYLRDQAIPIGLVAPKTVQIGNTRVTIPASLFDNGSYDICSQPVKFAICKGNGCTNFATSIYASRTDLGTETSKDFPIRIRVTDACGNIKIVNTVLTLTRL